MADNRKYYYLKLKGNYFDDDAIAGYIANALMDRDVPVMMTVHTEPFGGRIW